MATTTEHLPEDVTLQILYCLSVKPLLRFSSTSKRWRSIITSPQFAKTHFKLASQRNTLTPRLLLSTSSRLQSLDLQTPSFVDISNLTCPFKRPLPEKSMKMLGSCNGMVCVALDEMDGCYIWNPSTSVFLRLPNPEGKMIREYYCSYSGFGYVSATDDYKVFVAGPIILEIFSSRANSWKRMEHSGALPYNFNHREADLSNEALHWSTCHFERGIRSYAIVTFDLAKEEFGNVPLPLPLIEENEDGPTGIKVGVALGGCLCVSSFYGKDKLVQVWVMMEYGVRESWTKLSQFSYIFYGSSFRPVFHTDSSSIFWGLNMQRGAVELIRFNHVQNEDVADCSDRYDIEIGVGLLDMTRYVETLLWLDDHHIGVEESSKRLGTQHGASTSKNVDL